MKIVTIVETGMWNAMPIATENANVINEHSGVAVDVPERRVFALLGCRETEA